jgi:hypothetical protein
MTPRLRPYNKTDQQPRVRALCHTAASLMIASGVNVKTVQSQLAHKTATMTLDQYGHLFPDDLDHVAEKMDCHSGPIYAGSVGWCVGYGFPRLLWHLTSVFSVERRKSNPFRGAGL